MEPIIFNLNGVITYAKALDVYDGNVVELAIIIEQSLYHFKARLNNTKQKRY